MDLAHAHDWIDAYNAISPTMSESDGNNLVTMLCFGGFCVVGLVVMTLNVRSSLRRGRSPAPALIGSGLAVLAACGLVAVAYTSLGAQAVAIRGTTAPCEMGGHAQMYVPITIEDAVYLDGTSTAVSAGLGGEASWRATHALCNALAPGQTVDLLCVEGWDCAVYYDGDTLSYGVEARTDDAEPR